MILIKREREKNHDIYISVFRKKNGDYRLYFIIFKHQTRLQLKKVYFVEYDQKL